MKKFLVFMAIITAIISCKSVDKALATDKSENTGTSKLVNTSQTIANSSDGQEDFLLQVASKINSKLPIMIDRETQLNNVSVQGNALVYHYVLVNYSSTEITHDKLISTIGPRVTKSACTSPDLKIFWKNNISLYYSYFGNDGGFIGRFVVNPSDCGY